MYITVHESHHLFLKPLHSFTCTQNERAALLPLTQALINLKEQQEIADNNQVRHYVQLISKICLVYIVNYLIKHFILYVRFKLQYTIHSFLIDIMK